MKYKVFKESVNEILTETEREKMLPYLEGVSVRNADKILGLSVKELFDLFVFIHLVNYRAKEAFAQKYFQIRECVGSSEDADKLIKKSKDKKILNKINNSYKMLCFTTNHMRSKIEDVYGVQIDKMSKNLMLILADEDRNKKDQDKLRQEKKIAIINKIEEISKIEEEKE